MAGMWEFPGGKVEIGEKLEQALVREIREELNVTVQVGQNIGVYEHAYTHFSVSVHAFYCQKLSGKLKALDQQAYKWVELEEFENYPMGKVDRLIANEVVHRAQ
jgi:A/G-specific adenine glycosylase